MITAGRVRLPRVRPSPAGRRLGRLFKTLGHGPAAYAAILVAEEMLDILQRDLVKDQRVQSLSREVSRTCWRRRGTCASPARSSSCVRPAVPSQRRRHRAVIAVVADVVVSNLVHPDFCAAAGLDPRRARSAALANEYYAEKLRSSAEQQTSFLDGLGLMGGPAMRLWRRTRLV